ncbi:MAG: hypothetical protein KA003_02440 [Caldilineaceae bacterium]|nr:hypothetical protein [Caldilineaceae bacterium]MBP8106178.1 hypothetical protein [Caldilineaceae bacterium]MBP8124882.1 hypothetical protein [Caldilineaceae bacterium]
MRSLAQNRFSRQVFITWLPATMGLVFGALVVDGRTWAFHYLAHLPMALRLLLGAVVALVGFAAPWLANGLPRLTPRWDVTQLPMWRVVGGSGLLFWLGAERTHYGDGLLKLNLLAFAELQDKPPYIWKAPLDGLIGYLTTRTAAALSLPLDLGIVAQSVVAGMVFVVAILTIARRLTETPGYRTVLVLGLLALGSSQLWFGHIENYSLVTAAVGVTMALALDYLAGMTPLSTVGLVAGLAVSLHPQALFAMMALPLLTTRSGRLRQLAILAGTGLVVPALTVVLLLALGVPLPELSGGYVGDRQLFWTFSQFWEPGRLADIGANLWLLIPALPILLFGLIFPGFWLQMREDQTLRYLSGVGVGLLVYHFAFQNDLPRWQDWDLYAIVGPGVALWGLATWVRLPEGTAKVRMTRLLLPGLAFAVVVSVSWVGVNHVYRLMDPTLAIRAYSTKYVAVDLVQRLVDAQMMPDTPVCTDPDQDPTGCRRIAPLILAMPTTGEARETIFAHAPAQVGFSLYLPTAPIFLWVSPILDPASWGWGGDGVTFRVEVEDGAGRHTLWQEQIDPAAMPGRGWTEVVVDLSAYRGTVVQLWLVTDVGPAGNGDADRAAWGTPWIMLGTPDSRVP